MQINDINKSSTPVQFKVVEGVLHISSGKRYNIQMGGIKDLTDEKITQIVTQLFLEHPDLLKQLDQLTNTITNVKSNAGTIAFVSNEVEHIWEEHNIYEEDHVQVPMINHNEIPQEAQQYPTDKSVAKKVASSVKNILKGIGKGIGGLYILFDLPSTALVVLAATSLACVCYSRSNKVAREMTKDYIAGASVTAYLLFKGAANDFKKAWGETEVALEPKAEKVQSTIQIKIKGEEQNINFNQYETTVKTDRFVTKLSPRLKNIFGRIVYTGTNRLLRTIRNKMSSEKIFGDKGLIAAKTKIREAYKNKAKDLDLEVNGEKIDGLYIQAAGKPNAPTVIYFPGNGDYFEAKSNMIDYYANLGMNVLVFNYRGFGLSEGGVTTKESLSEDAEAVFQYARHMGVDENNIVVHGHSLGGLVAGDLMANHPKTTYIADRAPSSLVDVMELRAKEHSNLFFKTVSSIASSIILQLGQEMAPKDRINERLSDVTGDASNRMFIINCQNDETLFKAKAGSIEVGNQVPFKNKMVTDNTVHADLLKNAERAMIGEYLTRNNLITSFNMFFNILITPIADIQDQMDAYEALAIWQKTIYASNNPILINNFEIRLDEFMSDIPIIIKQTKEDIEIKRAALEQIKNKLSQTSSRIKRKQLNREKIQLEKENKYFEQKIAIIEQAQNKNLNEFINSRVKDLDHDKKNTLKEEKTKLNLELLTTPNKEIELRISLIDKILEAIDKKDRTMEQTIPIFIEARRLNIGPLNEMNNELKEERAKLNLELITNPNSKIKSRISLIDEYLKAIQNKIEIQQIALNKLESVPQVSEDWQQDPNLSENIQALISKRDERIKKLKTEISKCLHDERKTNTEKIDIIKILKNKLTYQQQEQEKLKCILKKYKTEVL